MRYLVTFINQDQPPFYTAWFDYENNFVKGMIIFDTHAIKHTIDGVTWTETAEDNL